MIILTLFPRRAISVRAFFGRRTWETKEVILRTYLRSVRKLAFHNISFTGLSFLQFGDSGFSTRQSICSSDDLLGKFRKAKSAYWLTCNHIDIFMYRGSMSANFACISESAQARMISKYPLRAGTRQCKPRSVLETTRPCPNSNDPIWRETYAIRQVSFAIGRGLAWMSFRSVLKLQVGGVWKRLTVHLVKDET